MDLVTFCCQGFASETIRAKENQPWTIDFSYHLLFFFFFFPQPLAFVLPAWRGFPHFMESVHSVCCGKLMACRWGWAKRWTSKEAAARRAQRPRRSERRGDKPDKKYSKCLRMRSREKKIHTSSRGKGVYLHVSLQEINYLNTLG